MFLWFFFLQCEILFGRRWAFAVKIHPNCFNGLWSAVLTFFQSKSEKQKKSSNISSERCSEALEGRSNDSAGKFSPKIQKFFLTIQEESKTIKYS